MNDVSTPWGHFSFPFSYNVRFQYDLRGVETLFIFIAKFYR